MGHITTNYSNQYLQNNSETVTAYNNISYENQTLHCSYPQDIDRTLFMKWYSPLYPAVSILATLANSLTIAALVHNPKGQTAHSKFIMSLAVSDCCIGTYCLVESVIDHWLYFDLNPEMFRCLYIFGIAFRNFSLLATLFNLLALGVDHYIAIVKPLHYNRIMSRFRTNFIIIIIWISSSMVASLPFVAQLFEYAAENAFGNFCFFVAFISNLADLYKICYYFIMPEFLILTFLYVKVFLEYRKFEARRQTLQLDDMHNKKAIITTLLIIGSFFLFWMPQFLYTIINSINYTRVYFRIKGNLITFVLVLLNALCDPIIYGFRLPVVREGYRIMFRKLCRWTNSSDVQRPRTRSRTAEVAAV